MDKPESRIRETCGNLLTDKITGILVGFAHKVRERDGWIDLITTREAKEEVMVLLEEYKSGIVKG